MNSAPTRLLHRGLARAWLHLAATVLGLLGLVACDSLPIEAAGKPGTDYAALTTWEWTDGECIEGEPSHLLKEEYAELARTSAETALVAQGRLRDVEDPSFLLAVYACRVQRRIADSPKDLFGPGVRHTEQDTRTRVVDQDILLLDVLDPQNRELLWRAHGANYIDPEIEPEQKRLLISNTVRRMVEEFPRQGVD